MQRLSFTKHSKYLDCVMCSKLLNLPVRLHPCGHTFCKACVEKAEKVCKVCGEGYLVAQPDNIAAGLIDEIAVTCLGKDCPWKGTYEQYNRFHAAACCLKTLTVEDLLKEIQKTISENTLQIHHFKEQVKLNQHDLPIPQEEVAEERRFRKVEQ